LLDPLDSLCWILLIHFISAPILPRALQPCSLANLAAQPA
jgi:hypothetical protein